MASGYCAKLRIGRSGFEPGTLSCDLGQDTSPVLLGTSEFNVIGILRCTNLPLLGGGNTPSRFMLQKLEITASVLGHLAGMQNTLHTLPQWTFDHF